MLAFVCTCHVISDLIRKNFWQISIALNQKVSITVAITQNCAINYIQLTDKNTK